MRTAVGGPADNLEVIPREVPCTLEPAVEVAERHNGGEGRVGGESFSTEACARVLTGYLGIWEEVEGAGPWGRVPVGRPGGRRFWEEP